MPLARYRYWIPVSAMATYTEEEIEALRNVATEGAKHILDGATEFPVWVDRMLLDVGDQVRWVAFSQKGGEPWVHREARVSHGVLISSLPPDRCGIRHQQPDGIMLCTV
jgi:hypothetical protein